MLDFNLFPNSFILVPLNAFFVILISTKNLGLWYLKGSNLDLLNYSDADWVGCSIDRKSTIGTCHFLGFTLVYWFSKKQNSIVLSTTEAEFIPMASCCSQVL